VAWSTSSGVINTVIRDLTAAVALAVNDSADASTLLGRSTIHNHRCHKGIVEGFESPTSPLTDCSALAAFRPALFEQAPSNLRRIGSLNEIFWHLLAPLYRNFWLTLLRIEHINSTI